MTSDLEQFGPTETFPCDENSEAFAVVRLAVEVSRDQLRTALAIGHAELNGTPPLDDMAVRDIRREVEGHLAAAATISLYRETEAVVRRVNEAGILPTIDAAINRAYTRTADDRAQQSARYGDGTVTLLTTDRGEITIDEPPWCAGHDGDMVGTLDEISHNGAEITVPFVTARSAPSTIMTAQLSHAPYLTLAPEPFPVLYVELDEHCDLDVPDGRNLSRALRLAAVRLDRALDGLARLRGDHR
ncbi:DUF6907 domain-containing protein [Streptomyces sp. NPDC058469]|uniref:DUF6907 domain-containing protein n=1 Tax=Streptomyces sp. NPDC058469 TaxID=3346514 RepID=UPI00364CE66D